MVHNFAWCCVHVCVYVCMHVDILCMNVCRNLLQDALKPGIKAYQLVTLLTLFRETFLGVINSKLEAVSSSVVFFLHIPIHSANYIYVCFFCTPLSSQHTTFMYVFFLHTPFHSANCIYVCIICKLYILVPYKRNWPSSINFPLNEEHIWQRDKVFLCVCVFTILLRTKH